MREEAKLFIYKRKFVILLHFTNEIIAIIRVHLAIEHQDSGTGIAESEYLRQHRDARCIPENLVTVF